MKLADLFLEKAIIRVLNGDSTDDVVKDTAAIIDKYLDSRFLGTSEEVQRVFVKRVLLPLAYKLMQEDKTQFLADLNELKTDIIMEKREHEKTKNNF